MARQRTEMKKIENLTARQVTFAKRRRGLFKKAMELSTLCDAEIAVILFSSTGKLYECTSSRTTQVIQRHVLYSKKDQSANSASQTAIKEAAEKAVSMRQMTGEELAAQMELEAQLKLYLFQSERLKQENAALKSKEALLIEEIERLKEQMTMATMSREPDCLLNLDQSTASILNTDFWADFSPDYMFSDASLISGLDNYQSMNGS